MIRELKGFAYYHRRNPVDCGVELVVVSRSKFGIRNNVSGVLESSANIADSEFSEVVDGMTRHT